MNFAFTGTSLVHVTEASTRHSRMGTLCGQKLRKVVKPNALTGEPTDQTVSCKACRLAMKAAK